MAEDEGFRDMVLADKRLRLNQGYAELSKLTDNHWYRVRAMLGDKVLKTESDVGGVMVYAKDKSFSVCIPNGGSDGVTRIGILDSRDFNENMMNYTGISLKGDMVISSYDCMEIPECELHGNYLVYNYNGIVVFEGCQ